MVSALLFGACGDGSSPRDGDLTSAEEGGPSGVNGIVRAGPVCPVERPGQPCAPRGVPTIVSVLDASSGKLVTRTTSDRVGHFRVRVDPGRYVLKASPSGFRVSLPVTVTVHPGKFAHAALSLDTGIR